MDFTFKLVLFILLTLMPFNSAGAQKAIVKKRLHVIVNQSVALQSINRQQLKSIYLGQKTVWPDGSIVTLVIYRTTDKLHKEFVEDMLGIYPYQFNRRWQKLAFSGFGIKPIVVESKSAMLETVASTPGAIGYIDVENSVEGVTYALLQ